MSKSDLLYVRNMTASESEEDEVVLDIWDDSKLNKAYDKALNIANVEVAKRLAMSTNTQTAKDGSKSKKPAQNSVLSKNQKKDRQKWKAGMHCRAVYEVDGVEYEAFLMRIINEMECIVRFLGYENSEIVPINSLKPSLGKKERNKQIAEALADNFEDGFSNHSHTAEEMDLSDRPQSLGSLASLKRKNSKKSKTKRTNEFKFPEVPPLPNLAQFKNIVSMDMPIPPPPPLGFPNTGPNNASEDQAISSMLLSWYMSGYYTGLYQGMKRSREESANKRK